MFIQGHGQGLFKGSLQFRLHDIEDFPVSAPYVLQGVVVLVEVHLAYWAVAVGLLDLLVVERDQLGPVVAAASVQQEPALGVHLVLADWTGQFGNWCILDM